MRGKRKTLDKNFEDFKFKKIAKKQKLQERGITLIALVVTIVILLILAGVTLNIALSDNGLFKKAKDAVDKYDSAQKDEESQLETLEGMLGDLSNEEKDEEGKIKVNKPKLAEGMIPIKYDTEKSKWVITNENDKEWYDYSEGTMLWANVMLSDGKYKTSEKGDSSKGGNYSDDGTTVVDEELGSMFVWIPRYAYSFNKYHTEMNAGEGTTQKITNVAFLKGTSNRGYNGDVYQVTYNPVTAEVGEPTPMVVHPGFTFDNKQLTGIWVGKFEAGMSGTGASLTASNNIKIEPTAEKHVSVLPNKETWRYITVGNSFLNCLNMKNSGNVYGISSTKVDTHLMKNIEWGVCSYLAASQYGSMPTMNSESVNNDNGINHQYAADKNYKTNVTQSTTRNETGIYDMCGGNWERVAAYYDNYDQSLLINGTSEIFKETENGIVLKEEYEKYWDKYEVGEEEKKVEKSEDIWRNTEIWDGDGSGESNQKRIYVTKKRYELMGQKSNGINVIGDGSYEVIKDYSYYGKTLDNTFHWIQIDKKTANGASWGLGYYNGDSTLIGHCARTFVSRGGYWVEPERSGVFTLENNTGESFYTSGFRPVLIV